MLARRVGRALRRVAVLLPLALLAAGLVLLRGSPDSNLTVDAPLSLNALPPTADAGGDVTAPDDAPALQENWVSEENAGETSSPEARRPWFFRGGERRPRYSPEVPPLFPEDDPGNDRIVEQLMYTLPEEEEAPIKRILLGNGFGAWNVRGGRTEFLNNKCPVDRCALTTDPKEAATADAILFKDHVDPKVLRAKRPMKQVWILYYLECPYHTGTMCPEQEHVFNWTATYRHDSDIVAPYEKWVYHDPPRAAPSLERNYAANKTKKVAWFVSNCHARNRRLQYAMQLSKHIPVDIYGACGSLRCPRTDSNCLEMLDKDYKFYLAFENSNCRDYITEKFFVNGLGRDVLPIVMGAHPREYAAVAPRKSYIHVEEFAGPEELAGYLHRLDADDHLYNAYFKWKDTGEFINTYFFCRVCAMVHAKDRQQRSKHYKNVQSWWRQDTCTNKEWRLRGDVTTKDLPKDGGQE